MEKIEALREIHKTLQRSFSVSEPKTLIHDRDGNVRISDLPEVTNFGNKVYLGVGDLFRIPEISNIIYRVVPDDFSRPKYVPKKTKPPAPKNPFTAFGRSKVNIYG